jgi:hypothetical protein
VVDRDREPGQLEARAVGQLRDVVRLDELVAATEQHRGGLAANAGHRVGEQVAVGRVDPGRGVVGAGHRRDRPHVVDGPCEQDRDGFEVVLAHDLATPGAASCPGSTTRHSAPGPVATT